MRNGWKKMFLKVKLSGIKKKVKKRTNHGYACPSILLKKSGRLGDERSYDIKIILMSFFPTAPCTWFPLRLCQGDYLGYLVFGIDGYLIGRILITCAGHADTICAVWQVVDGAVSAIHTSSTIAIGVFSIGYGVG